MQDDGNNQRPVLPLQEDGILMEIISKRNTTNASCAFCEKDITEVPFLFKQGLGTMCPECVVIIKQLMDDSEIPLDKPET